MTERKKMTLPKLFKKVADGEMITWLTCYDYPTAYLQDQAGVDVILVGDSLGMTMLGYESTLPVTMEDMIRHSQAVRRGAPNVWLVGDMPYMSYQPSVETAIRNAGRFMAEAACDSIKLEGGAEMADRIQGIVRAGIPAIGHLGLTPQSSSALGGFRLQGKSAAKAKKIIDDAKALEQAGAFMILLEMVPDRVCKLITERSDGCIIMSLGSGPACPWSAAHLPRHVWTLPALQAENGKSVRRCRQGDPRWVEGVCSGSHGRHLPAARELVRDARRRIPRADQNVVGYGKKAWRCYVTRSAQTARNPLRSPG